MFIVFPWLLIDGYNENCQIIKVNSTSFPAILLVVTQVVEL